MQRCGKVNNTTIWWPRKTDETNRFKVKKLEMIWPSNPQGKANPI